MKKYIPYFFLFVMVALRLVLRIVPLLNNNIYFTVDQGKTVLYVREILNYHRIFLKGPETSIVGVYAGPLWYYFEAIGYGLFGGDPIGGVLILTVLKLVVVIAFTLWISKKIGWTWALIIAFAIQFFWPAYEASLWSFNPFPLVPLAILLLIFLTKFLLNEKKFYYYSLIVILFSLNTDLAGAAVFIIFFIVVGFLGYRKKIIKLKPYVISAFIIPFLGVLGVFKQFLDLYIKTKVISYEVSGIGAFRGTNFLQMLAAFGKIIGGVIAPQHIAFGIVVFVLVSFYYFFRLNKKDKTVNLFVALTFILTLLSYIFFSTNRGWKDWHTVYLPTVLFIAFILMLSQFTKKIAIPILLILFFFQGFYFYQRLTNYMQKSDDPSILYNEISAIDWVYEKSENQGFNVYNYTDRFYDYNYQYLFWWHGLKKYGYLPCEYSNFPLSPKELYVPGYEHYLDPKRGCDRISFLIIQSDTNGNENKNWLDTFRRYHDLVETTHVGKLTLEKYYKKINSPNDFCIWLKKC